MRVIHCDGKSYPFNIREVIHLIAVANRDVGKASRLDTEGVVKAAIAVREICQERGRVVSAEQVEKITIGTLIQHGAPQVADSLIRSMMAGRIAL